MIHAAAATAVSSLAVIGASTNAPVAPGSRTVEKAPPSGDGGAFSLAIAGVGEVDKDAPALPVTGSGGDPGDDATGDTDKDADTDGRQDVALPGTLLPLTVDPMFAWLPPVVAAPPVVTASVSGDAGKGVAISAPAMATSAGIPTMEARQPNVAQSAPTLEPGSPMPATSDPSLQTAAQFSPMIAAGAPTPMAYEVAPSMQSDAAQPQPTVGTLLASTTLSRSDALDAPATRPVLVEQAARLTTQTPRGADTPIRFATPAMAQIASTPVQRPVAAPALAVPQSTPMPQLAVGAAMPPTGDQPVLAPVPMAPTAPAVLDPTATQPVAQPVAVTTQQPVEILATPERAQAVETAASPVAPPTLPVADPVRPTAGTTAPAFEVFGAIRAAASREDKAIPLDAATLATGTTPVELRHAIAATGDAQQAPLDMSDRRWPHAMIDRIETLRTAAADAANATDTRIRLVPDGLGSIQVSVKQEGATLHVHFAAEQAATAQLIQDAQPRLAAIAQERGLTLGQTAVDTGGAGQGQGFGQAQSFGQQAYGQPSNSSRQPTRFSAPSRAPTNASDPVDAGRLA